MHLLVVGTLSSLKEYESSRQWHNIPVMATINGLQRLFCTSWTPLVMLRSVGLQLVGALYPVKVGRGHPFLVVISIVHCK